MIKYLEMMDKYSDICAFKILDGETITSISYSEYLKDIRSCAYMLEQCVGNVEDKHIGIIGRSGYEYYVLMAAIMFSRAVAVPINENETRENIAFALKNSDVEMLVVDEQTDEYNFENVTLIRNEVLFDKTAPEKELMDYTEEDGGRLAIILHTSGTTSLAKGVALSADNVFHDCFRIYPKRFYGNEDSVRGALVYNNFPCHHLAGLVAWLSFSESGCTICYSKEPRKILSDLENVVIDFAAVTPAVLKLWIKCVKRGRMDRMGMVKDILSGGAVIDPDLVRFFGANGITLGRFYGQTEAGVVACNYDMDNHFDSIGQAMNGAKISIIDGEICIEFWGNMQGYYNNPEETEKVMKNRVIYSGDLGYMDEDGYVYITGRKKNLIILSGGENVSPEEIEAKLYENKAISECKVYEKNDSIYADIYAPTMTLDEVRDYVKHLNTSMPLYKRISHVEYKANEFEKTSVGKIKR